MTKGLIFWILMLFWLVFGCYVNRAAIRAGDVPAFGGNLLLFVLLALLGWAVYGPAVQ